MSKIDFDTDKEWSERWLDKDLIARTGEHFGLYTDINFDGAKRSFITPEGYIIPTPYGEPHYKISQWLFSKGYVKSEL